MKTSETRGGSFLEISTVYHDERKRREINRYTAAGHFLKCGDIVATVYGRRS